ncbi:alpha-isopropylmalate and homocitrate synthases signature 2 [Lucifera butyrica]|uniref:Alpha-isopropylmalate and homocitrate synthases signature 2 n=1 Tax=Lucifera butyrica TaxID=1351585 RepID=A0A498R973_9FIRM|nr:homocitrate synthase [Lucifera butyrica]VBB07545.1 alpha-isopropylmalate and homocitrate synthases signature 2 [Lucifera butyrica]
MAKKSIFIVDTTLRDGEQTAGVVFANHEKIYIATLLDEIGVDQIEAGIPVMGGDERKAVKAIVKLGLKASIMAWNRAAISDLQASLDCGVDAVAISLPTSDIHIQYKLQSTRERVLEKMVKAVEFAKLQGLYVSVGAEDASRSDESFLIEYAKTAKAAGADRLRYCDTVGTLDPLVIFERIRRLVQAVNLDIEMHTHNDFGMATANALAGLTAGATYVSGTVNGLGERAGNAALEELIMALKHVHGRSISYDTTRLKAICEYVSHASGRGAVPAWKSIVGSNMFAHESGIHADGALKNPLTYETFPPGEVGLERQIIIGKHSGTAALINKFSALNIHLEEAAASRLLARVRTLSVELKRSLFDQELLFLYNESQNTNVMH